MQYVQDYDETFFARFFPRENPPSAAANIWSLDAAGKRTLLDPYMKNSQISYCPSQADQSWIGYAQNGLLVGSYNTTTGAVTVTAEAQIKTPAEMILFGDDTFNNRTLYTPSQGRKVWGQNFTNPPKLSETNLVDRAVSANGNFPHGRHNEGVNLAFTDGHAKWMRVEKLYVPDPASPGRGLDRPYYNGF